MGLSWYCAAPPARRLSADGAVLVDWTLKWSPPPELDGQLRPKEMVLGPEEAVSFETVCAEYDREFCRPRYDLVCACCALETVWEEVHSLYPLRGLPPVLEQDTGDASTQVAERDPARRPPRRPARALQPPQEARAARDLEGKGRRVCGRRAVGIRRGAQHDAGY